MTWGSFPHNCCPDQKASLQLYEGNLLGAVGMLSSGDAAPEVTQKNPATTGKVSFLWLEIGAIKLVSMP